MPILRAGLVLVEHVGTVLPANQTYHLGKSHICRFYVKLQCMRDSQVEEFELFELTCSEVTF